ncbi:peptidase C1A family protein [Cavenderia fasciculata]|uniref:Peptidase C1A family protein n=1 Tax=Cavenderia fasciculata TaxID=261658 RepID=F4PXE5_CACFS|nr:peptidase C1A family protein [Cavenderia fasciculata]EGG19455.1 peptidase C1A family protein [Cavenderia fasciculata]|eukprot:XP_004357749.1 peptidase C1A family protein [Cavenderia fasciculata]
MFIQRIFFAIMLTWMSVSMAYQIPISGAGKVINHATWVEQKRPGFLPPMGFKRSADRGDVPVVDYAFQAVPANFNSAQQWSNCSYISAIQNQARCGSCWAFGAVESVSDRFCIHKGEDVLLSFQDLVTCDQSDNGCQGGDAYTAMKFIQKKGIVSNDCLPYTIPTCAPAQQPCLNFVDTPQCVEKCSNASYTYAQDLHFIDGVYSMNPTVNAIQQEIMTNGPVEACFEVYEDFLGYKSGVYQHTTGKDLGGHCVKMIGWGTQNNELYWICNNSWTTYWGNQGVFWIKAGVNECGIESDVVAAKFNELWLDLEGEDVLLSFQDLVTCDQSDNGCQENFGDAYTASSTTMSQLC